MLQRLVLAPADDSDVHPRQEREVDLRDVSASCVLNKEINRPLLIGFLDAKQLFG